MKQLITFVLFVVMTVGVNAQNYHFNWATGMEGTSGRNIGGLEHDSLGNIFVVGSFSGTVDLNPSMMPQNAVSMGNSDVYIQKIDPQRNLVWYKLISATGTVTASGIKFDSNGDLIIVGKATGGVDFDPGPGSEVLSGGTYGYVLKLTANGDFIDVFQFNATDDVIPRGVDTDDSGNIYVHGDYSGDAYFDLSSGTPIPVLSVSGGYDAFVVKYDGSGNYLWSSVYGSSINDRIEAFRVHQGSVVFSVAYEGTIDADPTSGVDIFTSNGSTDILLQKLNLDGVRQWSKGLGANNWDYVEGICIDDDENIYAAGTYWYMMDFDPGPGIHLNMSQGANDVFLLKLDANGEFVWVRFTGGSNVDLTCGCDLDSEQNIFIFGTYLYTAEFVIGSGNFATSTNGTKDFFIQQVDSSGNYLWSTVFGNAMNDEDPREVLVTDQDEVISSGVFFNIMDFDPTPNTFFITGDQWEPFLHKMSLCESIVVYDTVNACESYTWRDGFNYTSPYNGAFFSAPGEGCDTAWIGNIGIQQNFTASATMIDDTLIADQSGLNYSYQWIECGSDVIIPGATGQSFTPTANGNYACIINNGACIDTTDCTWLVLNVESPDLLGQTYLVPNPAKDHFRIENIEDLQLQDATVLVYDAVGRIVYEFRLEDSTQDHFYAPIDPGVYKVVLAEEGSQKAYSLVVQ